MIQKERIHLRNNLAVQSHGRYLLYWMQQSQRVHGNHALAYAIERANYLELPLLVYFGLTANYPGAVYRHYHFMLQGLQETAATLRGMGITFLLTLDEPALGALKAGEEAAEIIMDRGYLRHQRAWRDRVASKAQCRVVEVESDILIPVEAASQKQQYAAYTLRPGILRSLDVFLTLPALASPDKSEPVTPPASLKPRTIAEVFETLKVDRTVLPSARFVGGYSKARSLLERFTDQCLSQYDDKSNDPAEECISHLSPYIHFGQISVVEIAAYAMAHGAEKDGSFIDELVIRRELAINFVWHSPEYDTFSAIPSWARSTLDDHRKDSRPYIYRRDELEAGHTHDPYWNAAQEELIRDGKMHGYMRMYWGKKIIEWTGTPEEAYETMVYLNDRYSLDGRDPNGYAGIAWCFGLHDRPWKERDIFGKIRYMNDRGLKRKFNMDEYLRRVGKETSLFD